MDGFGQVAVLRHVADLEVLHHDHIVIGDQTIALPVQEVPALVGDLSSPALEDSRLLAERLLK
jgi:hypothetical protein